METEIVEEQYFTQNKCYCDEDARPYNLCYPCRLRRSKEKIQREYEDIITYTKYLRLQEALEWPEPHHPSPH